MLFPKLISKILVILFFLFSISLKAEIIQQKMFDIENIVVNDLTNTLIKSDGTLWVWGSNYYGEFGDGTSKNYNQVPQQLGTTTDWKIIQHAPGGGTTRVIKKDGTLWAWGNNDSGQLGDATKNASLTPKQIGTATDWKLSCGAATGFGIKNDGTLWSWGRNNSGQYGDGTVIESYIPKQVGLLNNWSTISCATNHTYAIKTDGTLWSWGDNNHYALGYETASNVHNPIKQIGTDSDWIKISAGGSFAVAMKSNGTIWSWGENNDGQLGNGTTVTRFQPMQIGNATNWKNISLGYYHVTAIKTDGTIWAWGKNDSGQLGDGTKNSTLVPKQISPGTNDWLNIETGRTTLILKNDGSIYAMGTFYISNFESFERLTPTSLEFNMLGIVLGTSNNDTISGSTLNDKLQPNLGNDIVDGKEGSDTIILNGNQSDYTIIENTNGTYTVSGPDGVDTLTNIELVDFDDNQSIAIDSITEAIPSISNTFNNITMLEDGIEGLIINIVDLDGDNLNLTIESNNPSLLGINKAWSNTLTQANYLNKSLPFELQALNHNSGAATVTVTLDDGKNSTSKTFDVTVNNVDDFPEILNNVNLEAKEINFDNFNITLEASDEEGDTFTLSAKSLTNDLATINLNNNILTVSSVPWMSGEAQIEIKATQDNNSSIAGTKVLKFFINDKDPTPPSINTYFQNITINEDQTNYIQNFNVGDINGDDLTINVTSSNPSILGFLPNWTNPKSVDNYSQGLSFTLAPIANVYGTATVTVSVSDGVHPAVTSSFDVTIAPIDDAPSIDTSFTDITKDEDFAEFSIPLAITDVEGDAITLTTQSTPSGIVNTSIVNNALVISPIENANGSASVKVIATANGLSSEKSFTLTVNSIDDLPTIQTSVTNTLTTNEDIPFPQSISYYENDADADAITVIASSSNPSLVTPVASNGIVNLSLVKNAYGTAIITVSAIANGKSVSTSFDVVVNSVDDPLVIAPLSSQTKNEDFGTFEVPISISDDEPFTVSAVSSNTDVATVSLSGSTLYIYSKPNGSGTTYISVTAKGTTETINRSFLLTVASVDDAPIITYPSEDIGVDKGYTSKMLSIQAIDIEGDSISYSVSSNNIGLVNTVIEGHYIKITPSSTGTGEALITLNATSNEKTTSKSFTFYVYDCYASSNIGQIGKGEKCWNKIIADDNWMTPNIRNAIHLPDMSTIFTGQVTDMSTLFKNKTYFNDEGVIDWDTSHVTNMAEMFAGSGFNQDISEWDTRNVTNMDNMFNGATSFLQDLNAWYVGQNPSHDMFAWQSGFYFDTQLHPLWGQTNIAYNKNCMDPTNIGRIGTGTKCKNLLIVDNMLLRQKIQVDKIYAHNDFTGYYTGQVTDMSGLFKNHQIFGETFNESYTLNLYNISNWDTSNVTNMSEMFYNAINFNQNISSWDTSKVQNMNKMFFNASNFNNDGDWALIWNTSSVSDMGSMFEGASLFNQDITGWEVYNVQNMSNMFKGAASFNQNIANWSTSNVTNMNGMFEGASLFNQDLKFWCVSKISSKPSNFDTSTNGQFLNIDLKQPQWGSCLQESTGCFTKAFVGQIGKAAPCESKLIVDRTILDSMIANGEDVTNVFTGQITSMRGLFEPKGNPYEPNIWSDFNQNISAWDVSSVVDMSNMFAYNTKFSHNLSSWDVSNVTSMSAIFQDSKINLDNIGINSWNTSNVSYASAMFLNTSNPPSTLDNWCFPNIPEKPTDFGAEFDEIASIGPVWGSCLKGSCYRATSIGQYGTEEACESELIVDKPMLMRMIQDGDNVSNVFTGQIKDMSYLFHNNSGFSQNISAWDVSNVTNMNNMFSSSSNFNSEIGTWDTSKVTDMSYMFSGATGFNRNVNRYGTSNIGTLDTSSVTNMSHIFEGSDFNFDISNWNTSNVTDMSYMFSGSKAFNQNLDKWDTSRVTNMESMFLNAYYFNGNVTTWDVSNVINMDYMFSDARTFNQNLSKWFLGNIKTKPIGFDNNSIIAGQPGWGEYNRNLADIIAEYEDPTFASAAGSFLSLFDGIIMNYKDEGLIESESSLKIIGNLKLDPEKSKCESIPTKYAQIFGCTLGATDSVFSLGLSKFAKDGYPIVVEYAKTASGLERTIDFTFVRIVDSFFRTPEISGLRTSFAFKSMDLTVGFKGNYAGEWSVHAGIIADSFIKPSAQDEYVAFAPSIDIEKSLDPTEPVLITVGGEIKKACGNSVYYGTDSEKDCTKNWNPLGLGIVESEGAMLKIGFTATTPPIPKSLNMFAANANLIGSEQNVSVAITTSLEKPKITDTVPYQGAILVYASEIGTQTVLDLIPNFNTTVSNVYNDISGYLPKVRNFNLMVSTMPSPFGSSDFTNFSKYFETDLSSVVNEKYNFTKPGFVISGNYTNGPFRHILDTAAYDLVFNQKLTYFSDILDSSFYNTQASPEGKFDFTYSYLISDPTSFVASYLPLPVDSICAIINCGNNSLSAGIELNTVVKNEMQTVKAKGFSEADLLGLKSKFEVGTDVALNPNEIAKETASKICGQSILKPVCNTVFQIITPLINIASSVKDTIADALGDFASGDIISGFETLVTGFIDTFTDTFKSVVGSIGDAFGLGSNDPDYPIAQYLTSWPVFDRNYYNISWNNGELNYMQMWLGHPNLNTTMGMSKWFNWYDYIHYNPVVANTIGYNDSLVQHDVSYLGLNSEMSEKTKRGHSAAIYWQNKNMLNNMYDASIASSNFSAPYLLMRYPECQGAEGTILFEKAVNCYKKNKRLKTVPSKNDTYLALTDNFNKKVLACRSKVSMDSKLRTGTWDADHTDKYTVRTELHNKMFTGPIDIYSAEIAGYKYYDRFAPRLTCEIGNEATGKVEAKLGFEVLQGSNIGYLNNYSATSSDKLILVGVNGTDVRYLCKADGKFGHSTINGECIIGDEHLNKQSMPDIQSHSSFEFITADSYEWVVPEGKALSIKYIPSDPELYGCKVYVNDVLTGKMASDSNEINLNVEDGDMITFGACSHYDSTTNAYIPWKGTLSSLANIEDQNESSVNVINVNPITTILSGKFSKQGKVPKENQLETIKELIEVLTGEDLSDVNASDPIIEAQLMEIINKPSHQLYTEPIKIVDSTNKIVADISKPSADAVALIAVVTTAIETIGILQNTIEYDSKISDGKMMQISDIAFDSLISLKESSDKETLLKEAIDKITTTVTDSITVSKENIETAVNVKSTMESTLKTEFENTLNNVRNTLGNNGNISQTLIEQSKNIQNSTEVKDAMNEMKEIAEAVVNIVSIDGKDSKTIINTTSDIIYTTKNINGVVVTDFTFSNDTSASLNNVSDGTIFATFNSNSKKTKLLLNVDNASVTINDNRIDTIYTGEDYIISIRNDVNGSMKYDFSKNGLKTTLIINEIGSTTTLKADGTLEVTFTVNEELDTDIRLLANITTDKNGTTNTSFVKLNKNTNEVIKTIHTLQENENFDSGSKVELVKDSNGVYSIETTTPVISNIKTFSIN